MKSISNNPKLRSYTIVLFIAFISIIGGGYIINRLVFSCFDDTRKIGIHQSSNNLEFARKNGLLLNEVKLSKNTIKLSDTLTLKIAESWIEVGWEYQCIKNRIQIVKDPNIMTLLIRLENSSWSDYCNNHSIELDNQYAGNKSGLIYFDLDSHESIKLMVYQLEEKFRFTGNKILTDSIEIEQK